MLSQKVVKEPKIQCGQISGSLSYILKNKLRERERERVKQEISEISSELRKLTISTRIRKCYTLQQAKGHLKNFG